MEFHIRISLKLVIQVHDMQDIQQLALVFMQSLDLYIKNRTGIHVNAVVLGNVFCQADLVLIFDVHEFLLILVVIHEGLKLFQLGQIRDPFIPQAYLIGQPVGQQRIGMDHESPLGNAVGLVVELLREHLIEVLELLLLQDLGMQGCYTVDGIAGHDCHIGHPDLSVIDDVHLFDLFRHVDTGIVIALVNHALKPAVDLLDDLIDPGQQLGEEVDGPFLQSFRHDGMVGVGNAPGGQVPCLIPFQSIVVHQQTHQLRDCQCGMGIVHLEDQLVRQAGQILVPLQMLLQRCLQSRGYEEILLFQTQLLALPVVILGIKDITDGPGQGLLLNGLLIIALVKGLQREVAQRLGVPDPEGIYKTVVIADDRHIIGYRLDRTIVCLTIHGTA